jgi:mevalonate kinase
LKIEQGDIQALGPFMDRNQALLADMGVSSPELERLIQVAREAGALGAKLSGGGRGGILIGLVDQANLENVSRSLLTSGATQVLVSTVGATGRGQKLV